MSLKDLVRIFGNRGVSVEVPKPKPVPQNNSRVMPVTGYGRRPSECLDHG